MVLGQGQGRGQANSVGPTSIEGIFFLVTRNNHPLKVVCAPVNTKVEKIDKIRWDEF